MKELSLPRGVDAEIEIHPGDQLSNLLKQCAINAKPIEEEIDEQIREMTKNENFSQSKSPVKLDSISTSEILSMISSVDSSTPSSLFASLSDPDKPFLPNKQSPVPKHDSSQPSSLLVDCSALPGFLNSPLFPDNSKYENTIEFASTVDPANHSASVRSNKEDRPSKLTRAFSKIKSVLTSKMRSRGFLASGDNCDRNEKAESEWNDCDSDIHFWKCYSSSNTSTLTRSTDSLQSLTKDSESEFSKNRKQMAMVQNRSMMASPDLTTVSEISTLVGKSDDSLVTVVDNIGHNSSFNNARTKNDNLSNKEIKLKDLSKSSKKAGISKRRNTLHPKARNSKLSRLLESSLPEKGKKGKQKKGSLKKSKPSKPSHSEEKQRTKKSQVTPPSRTSSSNQERSSLLSEIADQLINGIPEKAYDRGEGIGLKPDHSSTTMKMIYPDVMKGEQLNSHSAADSKEVTQIDSFSNEMLHKFEFGKNRRKHFFEEVRRRSGDFSMRTEDSLRTKEARRCVANYLQELHQQRRNQCGTCGISKDHYEKHYLNYPLNPDEHSKKFITHPLEKFMFQGEFPYGSHRTFEEIPKNKRFLYAKGIGAGMFEFLQKEEKSNTNPFQHYVQKDALGTSCYGSYRKHRKFGYSS